MGRDVCSDEQFLPETDLGFHYRNGPYDALVTLSGGRTPGLLSRCAGDRGAQPALGADSSDQ